MGGIQRKSIIRLPSLALLLLLLAACGSDKEQLVVGAVEGFAGLVVADEPRAALIGRDILANGGNAADAAVAMYFAMAVTMPSRASLGGGGVCISFNNKEKSATLVDFTPLRGGRGGVLPLGVRAMAALHARHGLNRWAALVSPAENLARFGHAVSRAFARDLARAPAVVRADPNLSRIFRSRSGGLPREGDRIAQIELSAVLSGVRGQGAGYFYGGPFTRRFAESANAAGHGIDSVELRRAVPELRRPAEIALGSETLYFSLPPAANGLVAAELWRALTGELDFAGAAADDRAHMFVEAAARVFADRAAWLTAARRSQLAPEELLSDGHLDRVLAGYSESRHAASAGLSPPPVNRFEDPNGAGVAAGDRWGNAVACSLTMNGLFGAGRVAPGTGIVLAAPPSGLRDGTLSPSVAVLGNQVAGDGHMALAASGGAAAPTALVSVMLGALVDDLPLDQAIAAARLHHGGAPDEVQHEPAVSPAVLDSLRGRGHALREVGGLGLVSGLHCVEGLIDSEEGCVVATDPRGRGLAARVE